MATVVLVCLAMAAAPAVAATVVGSATVPVTECPVPSQATSSPGVTFAPVPATTVLPASISVPPGMTVFGTGNVGTFVAFSLAPSAFSCTAIGGGADGGFAIQVFDPAAPQHLISYDFNPGGAGPNLDDACPYIPAAKTADKSFRQGLVTQCSRPQADVVTQVATGVRNLEAAVVTAPPGVKDTNLRGSGDKQDETVGVFLTHGGHTTQDAECTLPTSLRATVCLAALEYFVTQSTGAGAAGPIFTALRAALPGPPRARPAGAARSWSLSPVTGLTTGSTVTVAGSGCAAPGTAPSDLKVSVASRHAELASFSVQSAGGRWGGRVRAPRAPPGGGTVAFRAVCENDHGVLTSATATPVFTYAKTVTVTYRSPVFSRSALSKALPGRTQVPFTIPAVLRTLGVVVLLVMLIGFPAEIFNKTLEENYAEVQGWVRRRRPPPRLTRLFPLRPASQFAAFCVIAALFSTLVDPEVIFREPGWLGKGALLFAGFVIAIPLTTLVYAVPGERYSRQISGVRAPLRVLPLALVIAVCFVIISIAGRLMPGYVYGLVAGYAAVEGRKLTRKYEGFSVLLGACFILAASLLIWVVWEPVRVAAAGAHPSLPVLILDATMSQFVILGLEVIVFGLLPMRFLDGGRLRAWNLWAWLAVYATAAFFFVHLLVLNSRPVTQAQHEHAVVTVVTLFGAFGLSSCAFWAYFRYRPAAASRRRDKVEKKAGSASAPGSAHRLTKRTAVWIFACAAAALVVVIIAVSPGITRSLFRPTNIEGARTRPDVVVHAEVVYPAAAGLSMVVPGNYQPRATLVAALSHPMAAASGALLEQIRAAGGIPASQMAIRVVLRGNKDRPIRILGIRATAVKRTAPVDGVFFDIPPRGADTSSPLTFKLDNNSAAAPEVAHPGTPGSAFFEAHNLTLRDGEQQVLQIRASATCSDVRFGLAVDYLIGGARKTEIVNDNGRPFQVTGLRVGPDGVTLAYQREFQLQRDLSVIGVGHIAMGPQSGCAGSSPGKITVFIPPGTSAANYPGAAAMVRVITDYFQAINDKNYALYRTTQNAAAAMTAQQFAAGFRSTVDSAVTVTGITTADDGRPAAHIVFTSRQRAADGPDGEQCTIWHVTMFIESSSGSDVIGKPPPGYHASFQPCP